MIGTVKQRLTSEEQRIVNQGFTLPEHTNPNAPAAGANTDPNAMAVQQAPPPPAAPSLLDRLRGISRKRAETAREKYLRLLHAQVGRDLPEAEVIALADAMREAGVREEQFAEDNRILVNDAEGQQNAKRLADLIEQHAAATKAYEKHHTKVVPLFDEDSRLLQVAQQIGDAVHMAKMQASQYEQRRSSRPDLFPDQ
jgi:hypothetical protein